MMNKKIVFVVLSLLLIIILSTNVLAATVSSEKVNMQIVENNICTININDVATFEKKITDYDLEKKEITIGLKITNTQTAPLDEPTEIMLVIDNSGSMSETISTGGSRREAVTDSAKLLATELLKHSTVKVGVVSFSAGSNEGTITDAQLRTNLTNSETTVLNAITDIAEGSYGGRTDIEAGITLANQYFTGTCKNKFIVLLTDGIPNISLGSNNIQFSGTTATNTKNALIKIAGEGVQIISMMTGVENSTESQTGMTYKELAEEVFGTPEKPTVGKFYYITDSEIAETVSETILGQIVAPDDGILNDIDIYDYFPQEIVDNFEFSYVASPDLGTISPTIDLQNNRIVWHIDTLTYGQVGTVTYKLVLKDNIDDSILNKVLNTNEKVDITADKIVDDEGNESVISSDVSPKIKLIKEEEPVVEEPVVEEPTVDNTITNDVLPQTGSTMAFPIYTAVAMIVCVTLGIRLYINNKKDN